MDDEGEECCRICRDDNSQEPLFKSPCVCRGSVSPIHRSCLQHWLSRTNSSRCELCGERYNVVRTPRHGVLRSFVRWLSIPPEDSDLSLGPEAAALLSMAPLAAIGAIVLLSSAKAAIKTSSIPPIGSVTIYAPAVVAATMDIAILISFIARIPAYYSSWRNYRASDNNIRVLFPEDAANSSAESDNVEEEVTEVPPSG